MYVLSDRTVLQCMYCLTQLYDGRDMYRIYYIKINYMFRPFTLAIIRLRNKKLSKQLYSSYLCSIQRGGERRSEHEIWHVLCGMGGVGTGGSAIMRNCLLK